MTTELEYLELAEDCKQRINEKNKQIKKLKKQTHILLQALCDVRHYTKCIYIVYGILDEITKPSRTGQSNICMRKMHNFLLDVNTTFENLDTTNLEDDEMDFLTRLTIQELTT